MCGRYRAKGNAQDVEKLWKLPAHMAADVAEKALGRTEVRPTTNVAVLRADEDPQADGRLEVPRWGIQPEWSKRPLLNARADKLTESRLWSRLAADHTRRVLFVADGWYEWLRPEQRTKDARPQPFLHLVDGGAWFGMAGLLDVALVDGEPVEAVTVITTDAAGESARLHHRMPVVLPDLERQRAWLSPGLSAQDTLALCTPLADGVSIEPVTLGRAPGRA